MRRATRWLIVLLLAIILVPPVWNIIKWKVIIRFPVKRIPPAVIGHRGAADFAPENTMAAIDAGIAANADYIEIDIRQSKDGEIVVMHDRTVDRTTDGSGAVKDIDYAGLQKLNAATAQYPNMQNVHIPTLAQVIERIKNSPAKLLIEIKDPQLYPGMVQKMCGLIKEMHSEDKVMVFSFNREAVAEAKHAIPSLTTGVFIFGIENINAIKNVNYICPHWATLLYTPGIVETVHNKGMKLFVWTVNSSFSINYSIAQGVDGIITNHPGK